MIFIKIFVVVSVFVVMLIGVMVQDIVVIGGLVQDGFWNLIKKGVDDVILMVEVNGGIVNYLLIQNYDNFGLDLVILIEQVVVQGVDGIVILNWLFELEIFVLIVVVEVGVVIILYNVGQLEMDKYGVLNYFGLDEYLVGVVGGCYLVEQGVSKIMCYIQIFGVINLEICCEGVVDGVVEVGVDVYILCVFVNFDGDMVGILEVIKVELIVDGEIDVVINFVVWVVDVLVLVIEQLGKIDDVMLGIFDMLVLVLNCIEVGIQIMVIDQQLYLQGFLVILMLFVNLKFGIEIVIQLVLIGLVIVDVLNVVIVIEGVKLGVC